MIFEGDGNPAEAQKADAKVRTAEERVEELRARAAKKSKKDGSGSPPPPSPKRTRYVYDRTKCVACQQWHRVQAGEIQKVSEKHLTSCLWGR